jgi:putative transposase
MIAFIDQHREAYGVQPICKELAVAPSTYYAARSRPLSARAVADEALKAEITEVYNENYQVYGAEKIWIALARKGINAGRDHVARLMGQLGIEGAVRGKKPRTTKASKLADHRPDLVKRDFSASGPNRLWVADITYVATWAGFVFAAFITDVYSRRIVGWRVSSSLRADLAVDALEMAIFARADLDHLVHHSDRGGQYLAVVYTDRLEEEGAVTSVGSKGDSYDNALAEAINSLYKSELIYRNGPWRSIADVELATAGWVDWWNHRRIHSAIGGMPPAEFEATYDQAETGVSRVAV